MEKQNAAQGRAEPRAIAWKLALRKQEGWKAPGPDCIPAFWLQAFPQVTEILQEMLWEMVDDVREIPPWFVRGRTVMCPRKGDPTSFSKLSGKRRGKR